MVPGDHIRFCCAQLRTQIKGTRGPRYHGESQRRILRDIPTTKVDVTVCGDEHVHHHSVSLSGRPQKRRYPIYRPGKVDVASGRDKLCYDSSVPIFCSSENLRCPSCCRRKVNVGASSHELRHNSRMSLFCFAAMKSGVTPCVFNAMSTPQRAVMSCDTMGECPLRGVAPSTLARSTWDRTVRPSQTGARGPSTRCH